MFSLSYETPFLEDGSPRPGVAAGEIRLRGGGFAAGAAFTASMEAGEIREEFAFNANAGGMVEASLQTLNESLIVVLPALGSDGGWIDQAVSWRIEAHGFSLRIALA